MLNLDCYNPIVTSLYFFSVAGVAMFSMNPVILFISLTGSLMLFFAENGIKNFKSHFYYLGLFIVMALINPLVSHNGVTVLFVMNNNPVTLEALFYGVFASMMIISVLYWFRSFTQIMTSDKLLFVFGFFSPKIALILSMSFRYVSLFKYQWKKVRQTQKALGLYRDDNVIDSVKGSLRVFSIMITWALENGIITADSMSARGYGTGQRTHFSEFKFRKEDAVFLIISVALLATTVFGIYNTNFTYYPEFSVGELSANSALSYIAYGLLAVLPTVFKIKEALKWRCLKSKI